MCPFAAPSRCLEVRLGATCRVLWRAVERLEYTVVVSPCSVVSAAELVARTLRYSHTPTSAEAAFEVRVRKDTARVQTPEKARGKYVTGCRCFVSYGCGIRFLALVLTSS